MIDWKRIATFSVGPIGGAIISFISVPVLAWHFSAEDIGRISMLQVVMGFTVIFFSFGLDQAYVREYHETEDKSALLATVMLPGLFCLLFSLIITFIFSPKILSEILFGLSNTSISIFITICLVSSFLSRFLSLILRMQERGIAFSMGQILPKLLYLIIICCYIFFNSSFVFFNLLVAQMLAIVTVVVVFIWNTKNEWLLSLSRSINYNQFMRLLSFGMPLMLSGIVFWVLSAMDRFFLRQFSTFKELGIYSVAFSVAAIANLVSSVFNTIWAPSVYKWAAEGHDLKKIDDVGEDVLAIVYFILCLIGMFSWILAYALPEQYISVKYLFMSCMISPFFYMLSECSGIGIAISKKTIYSLAVSCIAALVNVLGNYVLVPIWGATGAAVSTAFAFWLFLIIRTEFSCLVWRSFPRIKLYITTGVLFIVSSFFTIFKPDNYIVSIASWGILGLCGLLLFRGSCERLIGKVKSL